MKRTLWIVTLLSAPMGLACEDEGTDTEIKIEVPAPAPKVNVTVGAASYEPSRVDAEVGKPITLVFTRTTDEGCGNVLSIPDEGIKKDLPLGESVAVTLTPKEKGELRFTCGMGMFDGALVVK